jgi:hypothetical protein
MVWLAVVFGWLVFTVLRERRQQFAFGALGSGLLVVAGLNVLNPDAFIVRTNIERAERRELDTAYALSLSPDATPTIVAALPKVDPGAACELVSGLLAREFDEQDWRTWNLDREQAKDSVEALDSRACPSP